MTVYDQGRAPEHWLLALDIASCSLRYADPADAALEQFYWMTANDFDVAFVKRTPRPSVVFRNRLAVVAEDATLAEFAEPLSDEYCFPDSLSLNEAFSKLVTTPWFVLTQGGQIRGIVTREDLAKPAASAFAFAHLLTLESVLRRLVGSYTNHPIGDEPQAHNDRPRAEHSSAGIRQFSQVINQTHRLPDLLDELGYTKREFSTVGHWAIAFRNHIADARRLNDGDPQQPNSLTRFLAVQQLMKRAAQLVDDRKQVWRAFGESVILDQACSTMFAGPQAGELPFAAPCFVITAWNPWEQTLDEATNRLRNEMLRKCLEMRTELIRRVVGQSHCQTWKEESFLVGGIEQQAVVELATRFGQRAIFRLEPHEKLVVDDQGQVRARTGRGQ